jgi:hypothetical protein
LPHAEKRRALKAALLKAEIAGDWPEVFRMLRIYQTLNTVA